MKPGAFIAMIWGYRGPFACYLPRPLRDCGCWYCVLRKPHVCWDRQQTIGGRQ